MSSGDPLVFVFFVVVVFLPVLFRLPISPHSCFLFSFFLSDSQLFIVFACAFFVFLFSSALVQYFFIPRVNVLKFI